MPRRSFVFLICFWFELTGLGMGYEIKLNADCLPCVIGLSVEGKLIISLIVGDLVASGEAGD